MTTPDPATPETRQPDRRSRGGSTASGLATTVVFAAFIAVLGLFPGVPVGPAGVPIVLQNMGPMLAGAVLGAWRATTAVLLFLALVAVGLPLLSGGRAGLAPFAGPSAGFLVGWILSALVTGLIVDRLRKLTFLWILLATFAGVVAAYLVGVPYLAFYTGDVATAVVGSLVFVPGDLAKAVVAALVATAVHRALPGRLRRS